MAAGHLKREYSSEFLLRLRYSTFSAYVPRALNEFPILRKPSAGLNTIVPKIGENFTEEFWRKPFVPQTAKTKASSTTTMKMIGIRPVLQVIVPEEVIKDNKEPAESPVTNSAECSYCLQNLDGMLDPRVLPCGHIHCKLCLEAHITLERVIQCPQCRAFARPGAKVEDLPKADQPQDVFKCEPCQKRGSDVASTFYCLACSQQMCTKHLESHDDFHTEHKVLGLEDYKARARKLDKRTCPLHNNQPYILGCKICKAVLCQTCIVDEKNCPNRIGSHTMMSLKDLEDGARQSIEIQRALLTQTEKSMERVIKDTRALDSRLDEEKDMMIAQIHKVREKHILVISAQYGKLAREVCEDRLSKHQKFNEYIESTIVTRQKELKRQLLQADHLLNDHQVDVISKHQSRIAEIQKVIDKGFPPLDMPSVKVIKSSRALIRAIDLEFSVDPRCSIRIDKEGAVQGQRPQTSE